MDYRENDYEYADMNSRYTGNRNLYCDLCNRRCRGIYHVIEKGDTLYSLSKHYQVSVSDLMRANPYVNVYNLRIGEELCIPVRPQPRMENMREENQRDMNMTGEMNRMPENSDDSLRAEIVTEEEVKAEEHSREQTQFSETDSIQEVLSKTGLSMADFVKFLAEKID